MGSLLKRFLNCLPANLPITPTRFDIDRATETLTAALKSAVVSSVNPPVHRGKPKSPGWNQEIEDIRRSSGKFFNRAKATGEWALYTAKKREFEYAVRRAKRAITARAQNPLPRQAVCSKF